MNNIKKAFFKVREDIINLQKDKDFLEKSIIENRKKLFEISEMLSNLTLKLQIKQRSINFLNKHQESTQTLNSEIQTPIQTHKLNIKTYDINTQTPIQTLNSDTQTPIQTLHSDAQIPIQTHNSDIQTLTLDTQGSQLEIKDKSIDDEYNLLGLNIDKMLQNSTNNTYSSTNNTYSSTYNLPLKGSNSQNLTISKGNGGVKTNQQTNQQTDNHIEKREVIEKNTVDNAIEILSSLDSVRKRLRLDFKALTDQEWLVFSTLYTIEEEIGDVNYRIIANKLNLTESSIRDYISRLIKKGIPINKEKVNNKIIKLSISPNLRKIAPLNQILELRELY